MKKKKKNNKRQPKRQKCWLWAMLVTHWKAASISAIVITLMTFFLKDIWLVRNANNTLVSALVRLNIVKNDLALPEEDKPLLIDISQEREPRIEKGFRSYLVDRKRLYTLLSAIERNNNYKYVLLDIAFPYGVDPIYDSEGTDCDSALYALIGRMRIVVASNRPEEDIGELQHKIASPTYYFSTTNPVFVKYPLFANDGMMSIPLRMLNEIDHDSVSSRWPYISKPFHGVANIYPIVQLFDYDYTKNTWQMSEEMLADTVPWLAEPGSGLIYDRCTTEGKIIVIGDLAKDGDDMHDTYKGPIAGPLLNYYTYLNLRDGKHIVNGWYFLMLLIFAFSNCLFALNKEGLFRHYEERTECPAWKVTLNLLDFMFGLIGWIFIISLLSLWIFSQVYDIVITMLMLALFKSVVAPIINNKKTRK